MLFKKEQKSLLSCLKLFKYLLKKFSNFKPLFHMFFYSGLCCFKFFACFCLLVILFEGIPLQVQFEIMQIYLLMAPYYLRSIISNEKNLPLQNSTIIITNVHNMQNLLLIIIHFIVFLCCCCLFKPIHCCIRFLIATIFFQQFCSQNGSASFYVFFNIYWNYFQFVKYCLKKCVDV